MVVIQERCEECEELMYGGKCRNPDCIKRKRKGAVIWGGRARALNILHEHLGTATVGDSATITVPDVTISHSGMCLIVAIGAVDPTNTPTVTWNGNTLEEFVPFTNSGLFLAGGVFGLPNAQAGTGDVLATFLPNTAGASMIVSGVRFVAPKPRDDYNILGDIGTSAEIPIIAFNYPSIFMAYFVINEPVTNPVGTWTGGAPLPGVLEDWELGQRAGSSGASTEVTIVEGTLVVDGGKDYYANYGPFASAQWLGNIVTLKQAGDNPNGLP